MKFVPEDVPGLKNEHGTGGRKTLNVILVETSWNDAESLKNRKKNSWNGEIKTNGAMTFLPNGTTQIDTFIYVQFFFIGSLKLF